MRTYFLEEVTTTAQFRSQLANEWRRHRTADPRVIDVMLFKVRLATQRPEDGGPKTKQDDVTKKILARERRRCAAPRHHPFHSRAPPTPYTPPPSACFTHTHFILV
jgi:hypothetical protein